MPSHARSISLLALGLVVGMSLAPAASAAEAQDASPAPATDAAAPSPAAADAAQAPAPAADTATAAPAAPAAPAADAADAAPAPPAAKAEPATVTTTPPDAARAPAADAAAGQPAPADTAAEDAGPAGAQPFKPDALGETAPGSQLVGGLHVWSVSVSAENQRQAEALFQQGNALMRDSLCIAAAAKYRQALRFWDHPNIHYNLSIALMTLDQPIETYEHLKSAVRYGPTPLQQERFEHAKNYLALLEKQVAQAVIRCDVPGAVVELDGQMLFQGPGQYTGQFRAGNHTVVATKEGLVTNHVTRMFEGGQTTTIEMQLQSMSELTEIHRRFPKYLPWTLIGAGVVVAGAGGGMHYMASQKFGDVDKQSRVLCPTGCSEEPSSLASKRKQGEQLQKSAAVAYAVGGALLVTGGILAYLNRTEVRVKSYDGEKLIPVAPQTTMELRPLLGPGVGGLAFSLAF